MSDNDIRKIMKQAKAPEIVREKARSAVDSVIKDEKLIAAYEPHKKKIPLSRRLSKRRVVAASLAAVMLLGGVTYAAVNYHAKMEKTDKYAVETEISSQGQVPKKVPAVEVKTGYVPEGFSWAEDKDYYVNEEGTAGYVIGQEPLLLDDGAAFTFTEIVEAQELTVQGKDAIYTCQSHNAADPDWTDQHLYMVWPDAYRVVCGWAWGHADKDELIKMMENTELVTQSNMVDAKDLNKWSDYAALQKSNEEVVTEEAEVTASSEDMAGAHSIGEEFEMIEDAAPEGGGLWATVTDVEVMDDLGALVPDGIPEEWKAVTDGNGNLTEDEIRYIHYGNGSSEMSEIVRSEKEPVKLVYATVEYRNDTDKDMTDVWFLSSLVSMTEENGEYRLADVGGSDYDYAENATSMVGSPEVFYCDVNGEETVKNYIPFIGAGDSVTVHYAWLMDEHQLKDLLYMDLTAQSTYGIIPESLEQGMVKVK